MNKKEIQERIKNELPIYAQPKGKRTTEELVETYMVWKDLELYRLKKELDYWKSYALLYKEYIDTEKVKGGKQ